MATGLIDWPQISKGSWLAALADSLVAQIPIPTVSAKVLSTALISAPVSISARKRWPCNWHLILGDLDFSSSCQGNEEEDSLNTATTGCLIGRISQEFRLPGLSVNEWTAGMLEV